MFGDIVQGAGALFTLTNILHMFLGTAIGLVVGILPGMGGCLALAILLPITFGMPADTALIMLLGIFGSSRFGGAFGAILLNIPGTASSAATALDGYPLNLKGESENAIMFANLASLFGGFIGTTLLLLLSPLIAQFALKFGPPEYTLTAIFGLTIIASLSGKQMLKGLIAGCIGLLISTIGADPWRGFPRFNFGEIELMSRLNLIWVLIAVFGGAQAFFLVREVDNQKLKEKAKKIQQKPLDFMYVIKKFLQMKYLVLRSSIIGSVIGAIPGVGGSVACWISYDSAKKTSNQSEKFGTGIPEGVVAGETSDNACASGSVIPLITLGIPGGGEAAVLMGALLLVGVQPGPRLMIDHGPLVFEIILSLFITTIMFFILGVFLVKPLSKIAGLSSKLMVPIIFCLAVVGTYGARNSLFGAYLFFIMGCISYILKKIEVPLPPIVIGFILGPIIESNLQRTIAIFDDNMWIILTRPICVVLIILSILSLFVPVYKEIKTKRALESCRK